MNRALNPEAEMHSVVAAMPDGLRSAFLAEVRAKAVLRRWWRRWPQAGVALPTGQSGMIAIEVEDGRGEAALAALANGIAMPATATILTAAGRLLLYRIPQGFDIASQRPAPGLVVYGDDAYILLPAWARPAAAA